MESLVIAAVLIALVVLSAVSIHFGDLLGWLDDCDEALCALRERMAARRRGDP